MPAKPRSVLEARFERLVLERDLDFRDRVARGEVVFRGPVRDRVEPDLAALGADDRDLLELDRLEDFFALDRWDFVSPFSRRSLFTVRAATSSARPP